MKSSLFSSSSAFLLRRNWANILRRDISTLSSDSTADKKSVEEFLNKDLPNLDPNKGLPKPELVKKVVLQRLFFNDGFSFLILNV